MTKDQLHKYMMHRNLWKTYRQQGFVEKNCAYEDSVTDKADLIDYSLKLMILQEENKILYTRCIVTSIATIYYVRPPGIPMLYIVKAKECAPEGKVWIM